MIMYTVAGALLALPFAIYLIYGWIACWSLDFQSWYRRRRRRRKHALIDNKSLILPHHQLMSEGKNWL